MQAILLIDHGSRRAASNAQLGCVARMVAHLAGGGTIVVAAHMELAEPDVAAGFAECVRRGATEVVAVPYLLAPGRHATEDIPRLVTEAAAAHGGVRYRVAEALGVHPALGAVVLDRAGLGPGPAEPGVGGPIAPGAGACPDDPARCEAPWCGGPSAGDGGS